MRSSARRQPTATTSVKIPARTKARIERAAKEAGVTVHAYLLEAIERAAARADRRREFVGEAVAAREEIRRTGMVLRGKDVHAYFKAKRAGKNPAPPEPVKIR
jgi:predicted DNA-binding protein